MAFRWGQRRRHWRRLASGRLVEVRACWVPLADPALGETASYKHPCPECGTEIISVRMPNGGWAHFEAAPGLTDVKHPCMHRGEGLSRKRDPETPDLFEQDTAASSGQE